MPTRSMPAARPVTMAAATTTNNGFNCSAKPRMTMAMPTSVNMPNTRHGAGSSRFQGSFQTALEIRIAQADAHFLQELVVLETLGFLHEAHDTGAEHALCVLHGYQWRLGHAGEFRQQEQIVGDGGWMTVAHVVDGTAWRTRHGLMADRDQVVDVDAVGEAALLRLHRRHAGLQPFGEQASGAIDGGYPQHHPFDTALFAPTL